MFEQLGTAIDLWGTPCDTFCIISSLAIVRFPGRDVFFDTISAPVFLSKSSILAARPDLVVLSHTFQKREGRTRRFAFGIHRVYKWSLTLNFFLRQSIMDSRASGLLMECIPTIYSAQV